MIDDRPARRAAPLALGLAAALAAASAQTSLAQTSLAQTSLAQTSLAQTAPTTTPRRQISPGELLPSALSAAKPVDLKQLGGSPARPATLPAGAPVRAVDTGCLPLVDGARLQVTPRLRHYAEVGGQLRRWRDCSPGDQAIPLELDTAGCPAIADVKNLVALSQAELVWRDARNRVNRAFRCAPRPGLATSPLEASIENCTLERDWDSGKSTGRARWIQRGDPDAARRPATGCLPDEVTYAHVASETACPPLEDPVRRGDAVSRTVGITYVQVRLELSGAGSWNGRVALDCQPSLGRHPELWVSPIGCEQALFVDHDGGAVLGGRRYWRTSPSTGSDDGAASWAVTDCVPDPGKVYPGYLERVGWEHDDRLRRSQPVDRIVAATPFGPVEIFPPGRREASVAHVVTAVAERKTGETVTAGCDVWRLRDRIETWGRPDGTRHEQRVGPAVAVGGGCPN